jgi:hypothetical protein
MSLLLQEAAAKPKFKTFFELMAERKAKLLEDIANGVVI